MKCRSCRQQVSISHLCPGCGEHYCLDHRDPQVHNCSPVTKPSIRITKAEPKTQSTSVQQAEVARPQIRENFAKLDLEKAPFEAKRKVHKKGILYRQITFTITFESFARSLFAASFILVLSDEIFRVVSYLTKPPLMASIDGNVLVVLLIQRINPLVASLSTFAAVCFTLFLTRRLTRRNKNAGNNPITRFTTAMSITVFAAVVIINIAAIIEWIFILA